jgi:SAM-dependent methyltransferase
MANSRARRDPPHSATSTAARDRRDWDDLARLDPYWAILSTADRRREGWALADFLATGEAELAEALAIAVPHGLPVQRRRALDVGCGVGRITLPLAHRFAKCRGVDVSPAMLAAARELAADRPNCTFSLAAGDGSLEFPDGQFDFVYCCRVLQHLPNRPTIVHLITELVRVLSPGGLLVFQLPSRIPLRRRLQPRRRLYRALRAMRLQPDVLLRGRRLTPVRMLGLAERDVLELIRAAGGTLVNRLTSEIEGSGIPQTVYYATKPAADRLSHPT